KDRAFELTAFACLAGPVEIDSISPETVRRFLDAGRSVTIGDCRVVQQVLSPQNASTQAIAAHEYRPFSGDDDITDIPDSIEFKVTQYSVSGGSSGSKHQKAVACTYLQDGLVLGIFSVSKTWTRGSRSGGRGQTWLTSSGICPRRRSALILMRMKFCSSR